MTALLLAFVALLGLMIGSFLNVVIWRVPRGESIVSPPSACPRCGHSIRARDNVPVISWLLLRGKCRDCGEPISRRYPTIELATAAIFVGAGWWALSGPAGAWMLPAALYLAGIGVALTMIDIDTQRLPNAIVLPSYIVVPVLLALASFGAEDWSALLWAAVGCAALWTFYFVVVLVYPRGMGFGDVKLAGVLGLYLGWTGWGALVVGAFAAFVLGGVFSLLLVATRGAGRKTAIPFGPWMIVGAAVGLVWGEALWGLYLDAAF